MYYVHLKVTSIFSKLKTKTNKLGSHEVKKVFVKYALVLYQMKPTKALQSLNNFQLEFCQQALRRSTLSFIGHRLILYSISGPAEESQFITSGSLTPMFFGEIAFKEDLLLCFAKDRI